MPRTNLIGRVFSHFKRVCGYARTSDYITGLAVGAGGPGLMLLWERVAPSYVSKGGFASIMRLTFLAGIGGGFGLFYSRSIRMVVPRAIAET